MHVEALTAALEAEGRDRAEAIRREAHERAAEIRAAAEAALGRRLADALAAEAARLRRELGGQVAAERREARGEVLAARDAFLERVFASARGALPREAEAPGADAVFAARLARALARIPGTAVVHCAPSAEPRAREAARERPDTRVEPDPALEAIGFRVWSEDGSVEVDATLPRLLALHRHRLALGVLRELAARGPEPAR